MGQTGVDEQREREVKFDVDDGWAMPDLSVLVPGGQVDVETVHLQSAYYDTADFRLIGSRLTLRRRTGDTDTGWQLKLPDAGARVELRWPVAGTTVPAGIREATLGVRGRAALKRVATLTTVRTIHRLTDADGDVLAEAVLDHVRATRAAGGAATTWTEVEVELVDGGEKLLRRAGKVLRKHGARDSASTSKVGKALGVAPVAVSHADGSLAALVAGYLDAQWEVIVRGDVDLRRGEYPVHGIRIAVRRTRSVLRILAPVLDEARAAWLDEELSAYAEVLGAVRDLEVLAEYFDDLFAEVDVTPQVEAAITDRLALERSAAETAVQKWLRTARHLDLLADLRSWHDELPLAGDAPEGEIATFLRRADRKARKRLADVPEDPDQHDESMHRARKAAKRARYVAELAAPVVGKAAAAVSAHHKKVQQRLGGKQDAVIAAALLHRAAAGVDGPTGFTLGVLHERARAEAGA